ncbi:peptidoglycan DD-metalloendopeptidase family protein [Undibacterium cyanobacteriorum]|uniref:Peptidoglycan DD-metalloendopeptidase family protein n=1 Tax=Undibacterium cyanobacteriorum TaxID=3073561 RepID=A0ABY9RIE2_9BURK|nr:peptidoglycan DD-metalloendopeptidase family protein [Undibacterium sp. 20NA77.5]WMW80991.1 peptidoglycan DD-metalloendopeptidase family protein [Undibacterium sp. 20NA77.5]
MSAALHLDVAAQTTRTKEKKKVEAERVEVQQRLDELKKDIRKTETAKERAVDALEESEQAISDANRAILDLQAEQKKAEARLQALMEEANRLAAQVDKQKHQLSEFLRQQYMHGDSDRIKLLLSGENPNRINRDMHYMSYISKTQAKLIESVKTSLAEVEKNKLEAQEAKQELDDIAQEEKQHKKGLESQKKKRAALLAELANKLRAQRKEADNLRRDEQQLNSLIKKLEEQARQEQIKLAQAEKLRKEKQAKALAAEKAAEKAAEAAGQKASTAQKSSEATETKSSKAVMDDTPIIGVLDQSSFAKLKGQLRMPIAGELLAKFGNKRIDSLNWKGVFIKANEGAEVRAIGAGRVMVSGWWRGYGNMILVDHGGEYISIYAGNQSVLKNRGDMVKAGEAIALVGNTFGADEAGLYFEMRYKGQAFDPLTWMKK